MILHKIGVHSERIHARSCTIVDLPLKDRKDFFNNNHLSGDVSAKAAWALCDKTGRIVAALSIRTPIQKKWKNRLEIARFSILTGVHVPGALSKLLKKVDN